MREQPDLLDDVADAAPQLVGGHGGDVAVVDGDRAGVGSIMRLTIRSVVVLPQPDEPTSTVIWPVGISIDRARRPPWCRRGTAW